MSETTRRKPGLTQRIIAGAALAYLLFIALYLLLRWLVGDGFWAMSLLNSFAHFLMIPLPVFLFVALIVRSRIAVIRLLPIMAIAAIWIGLRFLPKVTVEVTSPTIRVLTANMLWNNQTSNTFENWLRGSEADVICLQEVTMASAADLLAQLQDIYPYQTPISTPIEWSSNVILSRLPMQTREDVDLAIPNTMSVERMVVAFQEQSMAVYAVHLEWPQEKRDLTQLVGNYHLGVALRFGDCIRNQQIENLLAHLKTEPLPYIVAGDFNTSDFSVTYDKLAAHMHDSFMEAGWGLGGSWPVARAEGLPDWLPPFLRIEYIWHSDDLRTVRAWQGPPVGSDHLPLFAELVVE